MLASLTPREERVLRMRFGIGMNTDHTLEEVGQQFRVTRERIRQIEAKALRKLKHPSRSRKMRSFPRPVRELSSNRGYGVTDVPGAVRPGGTDKHGAEANELCNSLEILPILPISMHGFQETNDKEFRARQS